MKAYLKFCRIKFSLCVVVLAKGYILTVSFRLLITLQKTWFGQSSAVKVLDVCKWLKVQWIKISTKTSCKIGWFQSSKNGFQIGKPFIFMQDEAPWHHSMVYQSFFSTAKYLSSGMNPNENVWELLIREMAKAVVTNKTELLKKIILVWNHHPQMQNTVQSLHCMNCIHSMPCRIVALIAAKGGSTKY